MTSKCSNPECAAPISCHEGKEKPTECEFWMKSNNSQPKTKSGSKKEKKSDLPWTGDALTIEELSKVAYRNTPVIIGIIGKADAGKTTYLAMLFTLLLRGIKLKEFDFCGTKTINIWDELYQKLRVQQDGVIFPDSTPAQYIRLLHLALRNDSKKLKDILITDASGEVFSVWSKNRNDENAENARWVYEHSNAFILFIDCEDLINRKAQAKNDIVDLAQMLKHDLRNRPVIAVWSKSDKKEEVHPIIREKLQGELKELFENYEEIDISNFSSDDPDVLVHKNNIAVLDWLLSRVFTVSKSEILIENDSTVNDIFLNYKST
ncbi:MAG: hypothetical protein B7Z06_06790 [Flavobacteriales bacterium 32-35-8]|nr:MAG: hypothetical protein B7Z06_06790 [Flavobacteriales bacterium 32-35-8]